MESTLKRNRASAGVTKGAVRDGQVLCGPSGLSHPEWERLVSQASSVRRPHPMELFPKHFGTVEIQSSFEEFLKPELTRVWARKLAPFPDFQLTAKLHRQFTHERRLDRESVDRFRAGLCPLQDAGKLGCVLMQFPWSFRYTAENRRFLIELRRAFHGFALVAEMRHSSWMLDEAIGTFIDYHVGFCNIDQPAYTKAMPATSFLTAPVGYVRLHGRNCFNWFGAAEHPSRAPRYDYLYSEDELAEWVRRIDQIRSYSERTFVVANNGTNGKAITNALQLQALLQGRIPLVPKELSRACRRGAASQKALFTEYNSRAVA